ncbi:MAG: hypothetical protein RIQ59_822 [Bacteroidota bacterium]|jgi:hypothetical protein
MGQMGIVNIIDLVKINMFKQYIAICHTIH